MFDYIRFDVKGVNVEELLHHPGLEFNTTVNLKTGELNPNNQSRRKSKKDHPKALFGAMTITVIENKYVVVEGSLHEHHHENNYGEFTYPELLDAILNICQFLNIRPEETLIHNLEFGVNISPSIPAKAVIKSILCFKGQEAEPRQYNGKGKLKKFIFQQYELKIYDKGMQYKLSENILRFEIKVRRMQYLYAKKIFIYSLADLLKLEYYPLLEKCLTDAVSGLIVNEPTIEEGSIPPRKIRAYLQRINPLYWVELWENNQQRYREAKIDFQQFIREYGEREVQIELQNLINTKWKYLVEKPTELTGLNNLLQSEKPTELTDLEKPNTYGINTSNSMLQPYEPTTEKRYCKTCGREITGQDPRSIFCSEKVFGKKAKRCRNVDSNPRNNFLRSEFKKRDRGLLFDIVPYLVNEDLRILACKIQ